MKRSAAIIGPTPQFVRWAIAQPCPLRELKVDNLPDSTFRQLRSIRTLSEAMAAEQVFEQICVHPSVISLAHAKHARGFPIDDVLGLVGGQQNLDRCCHACPANAAANRSQQWAGCFGWLPADTSWTIARASGDSCATQPILEEDLPVILRTVIHDRLEKKFDREFGYWDPWYGLWRHRIPTRGQLRVLQSALDLACRHANDAASIQHLSNAVSRCLRFRLDLHVELVPPGFSDGSTWLVCAHCPECKSTVQTDNICQGCRREGTQTAARKFGVLGNRPYLQLDQILGETAAAQFVERYVASRQTGEASPNDPKKFGESER